jgi:hypothetical protein
MYEHIYIKVDISEYFTVERWWKVYVAIEALQGVVGIAKAKDVVPTVEPIEFRTRCAGRDGPQQIVFDILLEFGLEH